jgi:hypothetical protein
MLRAVSYLVRLNTPTEMARNGSCPTVCCLSKLHEYKTSVKQTVHVFYNKAASQIGKQC